MISKKLFRVSIQSMLRKVRLLKPVEGLRYRVKKWGLRKRNKKFISENPGFALPPAYLAFDAYSSPDWEFYKQSGEITAKYIAGITAKHRPANTLKIVFEWGCGPARVTRQLKAAMKDITELHASDYNPETIEWCKKNIPGVDFVLNSLQPPLPYADNKFDFIYAISVFTHLSEASGLQWSDELYRILKPGGILLVTTAGDNFYKKELLAAERKKYTTAGIVIRDKYEEGKKMFFTLHSPVYIREKLLKQFEILERVPSGFPYMHQEYWVVRKK